MNISKPTDTLINIIDESLPFLIPSIRSSMTKNGNLYDGVLQDCEVHTYASGHIFKSRIFDDGDSISTSEVIYAGELPGIGQYVETKSGSRYFISSYKMGQSKLGWLERKQKHLEVNWQYFSRLQWSEGGRNFFSRIASRTA